ncbi:MAG: hypothetical protein K9M80_02040 [Candidatus Marinimicrobia bacterium]|nr:hypothetical protein [Candidatus Neomarinimicrobiota bacterium]
MAQIITLLKSLRHLDFSFLKHKKPIKKIREHWGKPIHKNRKFDLISLYHKLTKDNNPKKLVDETTWQDLNMDAIFAKIDRNISTVGSQYLYNLLHCYENDLKDLNKNSQQYNFFLKNKKSREKILKILYKLRHNNAHYIPTLIYQDLPARPTYYFLFYLSSATMLISTVMIFFNPIFLFVFMGLALMNLLINFFYGRKITGFIVDISYLSTLLKVGIKLSNTNIALPQIRVLKKLRNFSIALHKKMGWLVINSAQLNELAAAAVEYLNYFCLFNIIAFMHSIKTIRINQDKLARIYEVIGSLDTNIAIASYLKSLPSYCYPAYNNENIIKAENIYHPLLEEPVANNFCLQNKSVLITGSNMAGKTTFMKTIGVNIILARSIGICLAENADLPQLLIKSSIRRSDEINANKSYYFKEIEAIHKFMTFSSQSEEYLFLIDEIFRGTNTIERLAASTSVLRYLSQNSMVFVTTHDIELQKLLSTNFEMYHFCEIVRNNKHFFDYTIKSGPTSSRNAIKLLELKGYPQKIIKEANELAEHFDRQDHIFRLME